MKNPESDRYNRRTFVTALGTAGAVAIAGCTDDGDQTGDNTTDPGANGEDDGSTQDGEDDDGLGDTDDEDDGIGDDDGTGDDDETTTGDEDQYELSVHVMDSMETPVEGAAVDVEDEDGEDAHDGTTETDGEGRAMFDLADGMYTVHVRADGFADAEEDVTIDGADEDLQIELEDDDGEEMGDGDGEDEETGGDGEDNE